MEIKCCVAVAAFVFGLAGCANSKPSGSSHPDFDRLYLSGKAIQGSLVVGVTYSDYGGILRAMAPEISVLRDKLKFQADRHAGEDALLRQYAMSLEAFANANTVWKDWIESQKYSFAGSKNLKYYKDSQLFVVTYGLFDHKEISMELVQAIWLKAGERLEKANAAYYEAGNVQAKDEMKSSEKK